KQTTTPAIRCHKLAINGRRNSRHRTGRSDTARAGRTWSAGGRDSYASMGPAANGRGGGTGSSGTACAGVDEAEPSPSRRASRRSNTAAITSSTAVATRCPTTHVIQSTGSIRVCPDARNPVAQYGLYDPIALNHAIRPKRLVAAAYDITTTGTN